MESFVSNVGLDKFFLSIMPNESDIELIFEKPDCEGTFLKVRLLPDHYNPYCDVFEVVWTTDVVCNNSQVNISCLSVDQNDLNLLSCLFKIKFLVSQKLKDELKDIGVVCSSDELSTIWYVQDIQEVKYDSTR